MKNIFIVCCFVLYSSHLTCQSRMNSDFDPESHKIIESDRGDGRYTSTRGLVQHMIRNFEPALSFKPQFTAEEMISWRDKIKEKMIELVNFPTVQPQPIPKLLNKTDMGFYTLEKWEIYPQPGSVVPFYILVPHGVSKVNPAPAVLCFSGSAGTKETLVGVDNIVPNFVPRLSEKNEMALDYAKAGFVSVAIDHPGIGESSDLERFSTTKGYHQVGFTRYLEDLGWSFLGLSSFQGQQVLNWMRKQNFIDSDKIALSGHSLGTEPVMVLAVLNDYISAVVYNDFLCRNLERIKVLTYPNEYGVRSYYSGLYHFPPGYLKWFDYPDIVASLAPMPIIFTEGGGVSDLNLVEYAYEIMGGEDNISIRYYPKYSDSIDRILYDTIPEGLTMDEYFRYTNVDAPNHYFKSEHAVPWLKNILLDNY